MNRKIPFIRIIILLVSFMLLFSVKGSVEAAVADDVAVMSMNDATASRSMIVYEENRQTINNVSYGVLGLVGIWTIMGFKKKG